LRASRDGLFAFFWRVFEESEGYKLNSKPSSERGRSLAGVGAVLALLGAIFLAPSILGGGLGTLNPPVVQAQGDLDITKSASGLHNGDREYRLMANTASGFTLGPADVVTIVDDVDDDLNILLIHDVADGWTCAEDTDPTLGKIIECTLDDNTTLTEDQVIVVFYDACDTLDRGSVDNTARIFLNGVEEDSDVANPNVNECEATPTPTATPTGTPATATPTGTQPPTSTPTATPVLITPPVTGDGGPSGGGDSAAWFGLASLIAGLGLLGWARRLSSRR
jgi:hypothetical protein